MTIVELMLTITILLVVWGSAMSSQIAASNLVLTGRETGIASADLQSCMERILAMPHAQVPIPGSEFEADEPIEIYEGLHLSAQRIVATYPGYVPGGPVPDLLTVVLTLTWEDFEGRPRTMRLSSLRSR